MERPEPGPRPAAFNGRLGATVLPGGVQFAVHAAPGGGATLLLFDRPEDATPSRSIQLDPLRDRTASYWHVFVPGAGCH